MVKCIHYNCGKSASFNYINHSYKYCKAHKKAGMIDVKNKKCKENGCRKIPSFNYPEQTIPEYCKEHKKEKMENIHNIRCAVSCCKTTAIYKFYKSNDNKKFCHNHKDKFMINYKLKNEKNRKNQCYVSSCTEHKNINSDFCIIHTEFANPYTNKNE